MRKTLTKVGNSLALVLERPILDLLGIDSQTELDVTLEGRRLVVRFAQEAHMTRYGIWIRPADDANPQRLNADNPAVHYLVEPLKEFSTTEGLFVLRHPPTSDIPDAPVKMGGYNESDALRNPRKYRVVMKGSPGVWEITTPKYNEAAGRVEIGLKQVQ